MAARFEVTESGSVAEIRFDDGGMNLLSSAALNELDTALDGLSPAPTVLLFRSLRPQVFAAGADMREMAAFDGPAARRFSRDGQRLMLRIARLPMKTIALIDGDCFGGALDLALAFDVRIATPRSRFSHPGGRIAIVTGFGGTTRWRRILSAGAAARLFLDNGVIAAEEALGLALISSISEALPDVPEFDGQGGPAFVSAKLAASLQHLSPLQSTLLGRRLAALHELRNHDGHSRNAR